MWDLRVVLSLPPRHNPINAYIMGGIARDAELGVDGFKKLDESLFFRQGYDLVHYLGVISLCWLRWLLSPTL